MHERMPYEGAKNDTTEEGAKNYRVGEGKQEREVQSGNTHRDGSVSATGQITFLRSLASCLNPR